MGTDKVCSLSDAVTTHVRPGSTVALEGFGHLVPMAAAHELIRQGATDLTICRMSCDLMIDQLMVAGCMSALVTSFVGNSSGGSLHELRRAVEGRSGTCLRLSEFSHGGMIARYSAGAARLPMYPIRSYQGSDLRAVNPDIRTVVDPFTGSEICVVPPLIPDVSIIHAQRADRTGNVQAWGILGVQQEVAFAGRAVIVTVEEIVETSVIRSDPNRTIVPSQVVDAVVECPGGAFPSSVQGYYDRDDAFFRTWSESVRTPGVADAWVRKYVLGTRDHREFLEAIGSERLAGLPVDRTPVEPVGHGGSRSAVRP